MYHLIQLPPFLLFILIISFGGIIAELSTLIIRKYIQLRILRSHNEITGFLFLSIASFYAFLLSFVIFMVWGHDGVIARKFVVIIKNGIKDRNKKSDVRKVLV